MSKLSILIISREIFPQLSPRAFRTTELAKELARQGHTVTLYAVLGKYDYSDFEKETGISVQNIGKMLFATNNSDGKSRYSLIDKILFHALHRLIEFPDIELMFRIHGIIKKERKKNLLITIAFPHTIHWGAALAKKTIPKNKYPDIWISDCGDPYMGDPINKKKYSHFKYIEKYWGRKTDYITIPLTEGKKGYYKEFYPKIRVIPQGFDFDTVKLVNFFIENKIPTFAYAGSVYPGNRDPKEFCNFLSTLNQDFKFVVYTNNPDYYSPFKLVLKHKLEIYPYITRVQLLFELSKMDFLVNLTNPDTIQLPSKIIDYLLTKRPIMEVSIAFPQHEKKVFLQFLDRNYNKRLTGYNVEEFDIKNVAQKFISLYYENKQ